jgi:hypothetical protein
MGSDLTGENEMPIPRGIRNNNPGNLDFVRSSYDRDPWIGETGLEIREGKACRFTTFDTAEHGIRALAKTLLTYCRLRRAADGTPIDTVQEIIDRWAPPHENDTDAYAKHVRDLLNIEKGGEINIEDPATLAILVESIIRHENGCQPYSEDVIRLGVGLALA